MGKETRQQAPQYKLHYMCLPWCYRTMITSYQLPWCYCTMVSSYLLLLKTLFSPTLLLLSYHAITIAPKIYCKWTSLSDRTYRTNLGVCKSKHKAWKWKVVLLWWLWHLKEENKRAERSSKFPQDFSLPWMWESYLSQEYVQTYENLSRSWV